MKRAFLPVGIVKALYGKSMSDVGTMSEKERKAFFKELEKKYPK